MADFTYNGPQASLVFRGILFPKGEAVTIEDTALAQKLGCLVEFGATPPEPKPDPDADRPAPHNAENTLAIEVKRLEAENEHLRAAYDELDARYTALEEAFDVEEELEGDPADGDYPAAEGDEEDETATPTIGSGILPEDWRSAHWKTKQKWCSELLGLAVSNDEEGTAALEAGLAS